MRDGRISNPVILEIDIEVAWLEGTRYSDRNAAKDIARVGGGIDDLRAIHFDAVKARTHFDLPDDERPFFQAEVLIEHFIPLKYIKNIGNFGIAVPSGPIQAKPAYTAQITRKTPTAFIFLVDQAAKALTELLLKLKSVIATINGHGYVDLGLSVKWATCNVGASSPEDYGSYYAWGETSVKTIYTVENCSTYGITIGDIGGTSCDVAHVKWGGSWRMPTEAEFEELVDRCTWTWTTQGGKAGYKVTGPSSKSIFLPATGYRFGASLNFAGSHGYRWSSTPDSSGTSVAYSLRFGSSSHRVSYGSRSYGHTVRPVSE